MYNLQYLDIILFVLTIWAVPWKAYALWLAVKRNHRIWFFILLLLNTFGILEIIYILKIVKKSWKDVKTDFKRALFSLK